MDRVEKFKCTNVQFLDQTVYTFGRSAEMKTETQSCTEMISSERTQLQNSFVTDEDLRGRNVLHIDSIAPCSLAN